jgi:2-methylisocitrate lyase-like PEP mutase family enzyme
MTMSESGQSRGAKSGIRSAMDERVDVFHRLHAGSSLLLLPNCWDAGSARLIESLGAKAIATTSAGVAWAQGYPDGNALPVDRLLGVVRSISRVIRVPLTVDLEGGYADDAAVVGELVAAVVDAGAVGINLEDGAGAPERLAAKIESAKRAGARAGVELFVNARTDVYLRGLLPPPSRVAETLARAACYREAGADGIFVPGLHERPEVREIASAGGLPLNLMVWPGLAPASDLAALGVRRLSAGAAIAQALSARALALATGFLAEGRSDAFADTLSYADLNALFAAR